MNNGSQTNDKVMLFTPYFRQSRGNSTTAKRLVKGLREKGITVHVFAYEERVWDEEAERLFQEVDLIHIIHLKRFSHWMKRHKDVQLNKPYILTSGGTDINEDLKNPEAVKLMVSVADESCAITVFSKDGKDKIVQAYPHLAERIYVIAQSVEMKKKKVKSSIGTLVGSPHFLLPAGLRPVKDVLFLFDELLKMRKTWPNLTFTIIGPVLDEAVYKKVENLEKEHSWFRYQREIEFEEMPTVYEAADYVLNTSISEGQPSALLEAMKLEKPVLARKIPGNESIIVDKLTGMLFQTPEEFHEKVNELFAWQEREQEMVQLAKKYVEEHHSVEREIRQFLQVYEHCLAKAYV